MRVCGRPHAGSLVGAPRPPPYEAAPGGAVRFRGGPAVLVAVTLAATLTWAAAAPADDNAETSATVSSEIIERARDELAKRLRESNSDILLERARSELGRLLREQADTQRDHADTDHPGVADGVADSPSSANTGLATGDLRRLLDPSPLGDPDVFETAKGEPELPPGETAAGRSPQPGAPPGEQQVGTVLTPHAVPEPSSAPEPDAFPAVPEPYRPATDAQAPERVGRPANPPSGRHPESRPASAERRQKRKPVAHSPGPRRAKQERELRATAPKPALSSERPGRLPTRAQGGSERMPFPATVSRAPGLVPIVPLPASLRPTSPPAGSTL
jgi:hypothetical protein